MTFYEFLWNLDLHCLIYPRPIMQTFLFHLFLHNLIYCLLGKDSHDTSFLIVSVSECLINPMFQCQIQSLSCKLSFAKLNPAQFQLSFSLAGLRLVLFPLNPATHPTNHPTRESIIRAIKVAHMSVICIRMLCYIIS